MDIYVLDTSALINDKQIIGRLFGEIIIHSIVLEEIDNIKKNKGERGAYAREVNRQLSALSNRGDFGTGIRIKNKIIKIDTREPNVEYLRHGFEISKKDNLLLCVAKEIKSNSDSSVIFVTGDKNLAIKASLDIEVMSVSDCKKRNKKKKYHNKKLTQ